MLVPSNSFGFDENIFGLPQASNSAGNTTLVVASPFLKEVTFLHESLMQQLCWTRNFNGGRLSVRFLIDMNINMVSDVVSVAPHHFSTVNIRSRVKYGVCIRRLN